MKLISRLEQAASLDKLVEPGQRVAQMIPAGKFRDALHGTWLGHPVHPPLVQAVAGTWLSASIADFVTTDEAVPRRLTAIGLAAAAPAIAAGAADWSEQHEQQLRVGVIHAAANALAATCYGTSLLVKSRGAGRWWRLGGLTALAAGGLLGGHLSFRLAGGANHAEAVPHLVKPGWQYLTVLDELPDGKPARRLLGEVPLVAVRDGDQVQVLADRCSHMSGPLSDGDLEDGCLTCPWHGSVFRLSDGSVARGPATAPQPAFETRVVAGGVQVRLPGAG
ncbi:MAG TPA: Rieske (2Fe-2S) protein [Streptosporangiaceae bacterium]|jgi:nitrite reductase/ring-hydroxylating ferredoxin subunit/nucleotide-binding universal stress UspA family protein|nr:Rieske (2Fe-2S) protein [Streptosporangiaceae bacterium]